MATLTIYPVSGGAPIEMETTDAVANRVVNQFNRRLSGEAPASSFRMPVGDGKTARVAIDFSQVLAVVSSD